MMRKAQFPAVQTSALRARRFVSNAVGDVPDEVAETIALITSELATNSVRHAASAFEIRVEQLPDRIRIEVEDDGEGDPVMRSPEPTDTSGRGLQIVQALADTWGVLAKAEPPGKIVWASIALRTPEAHTERTSEVHGDVDERRPRRARGSGSGGSSELHGIDGRHHGVDVELRLCTAQHRSARTNLCAVRYRPRAASSHVCATPRSMYPFQRVGVGAAGD